MSIRLPYLFPAAIVLTLLGCDATSPAAEIQSADVVTDDLAVAVGNAIGLESGGALDEAALAAEIVRQDGRSAAAGCEASRSLDEATGVWTRTVFCERGREDGPAYALFQRTQSYQFRTAENVVTHRPAEAASMDFRITEPFAGLRRTPATSHTLTNLGGTFNVTGLNGSSDLITLNGNYVRAATDTLRARQREAMRTLTYELTLILTDVAGPAQRAGWSNAVSGTLSGRLEGVRTMETPAGTREQRFDRTFTVDFSERDNRRVARITMGNRTFFADVVTGQLLN